MSFRSYHFEFHGLFRPISLPIKGAEVTEFTTRAIFLEVATNLVDAADVDAIFSHLVREHFRSRVHGGPSASPPCRSLRSSDPPVLKKDLTDSHAVDVSLMRKVVGNVISCPWTGPVDCVHPGGCPRVQRITDF
jgi:hypothetical protein